MKTKRAQTFTMAVLAGSLALSGVAGAFDAATTHPRTTRESVSSTGVPAVGLVQTGSLSANGRYVAFASAGSDLVDGDTNGLVDVFLRDMNSGTTAMVSASQTGAPADL